MDLKPIQLSPSRLNLFSECQRCFWLKEHKKAKRPSGIMPSIPRGVDRDLKLYYDNFRGSLPPEIQGHVPGVLFGSDVKDFERLEMWRKWQTRSFKYTNSDLQVMVYGAIDDCLIDGDVMIPLDYKTKASTPKTNGAEYYQLQLDCYMLFLEELGYKTSGSAYLAYYFPDGIQVPDEAQALTSKIAVMNMGTAVYKLDCSRQRAIDTIIEACECLRGDIPASNAKCEYCELIENGAEFLGQGVAA